MSLYISKCSYSDKSTRNLSFTVAIGVEHAVSTIRVAGRDPSSEPPSSALPVSPDSTPYSMLPWSRTYAAWRDIVLAVAVLKVDSVRARLCVDGTNSAGEPSPTVPEICEHPGSSPVGQSPGVASGRRSAGAKPAPRYHRLYISVLVS